MIERGAIIEGLVKMRFKNLNLIALQKLIKVYDRFDNDFIANEYFKVTGTYIRQIFSNQFISLT